MTEEEKEKKKRWERVCEFASRTIISQEKFEAEAEVAGATIILSLLSEGEKQEADKQDVNLLFQCAWALSVFKEEKDVRVAMIYAIEYGKLPKVVLGKISEILKDLSGREFEEMLEVYFKEGHDGLKEKYIIKQE